MTQKNLIILAIVFGMSQFCMAQPTFNYGPEVGMAIPQLPEKRSYDFIRESKARISNTEIRPLVGPLVGFQGQMNIKNHFQVTSGLQYQMSQTKYFYDMEEGIYDYLSSSEYYHYTSERRMDKTFHKLGLPLAMGYTFQIGKLKPSVFLGIRPNLILTGNHYEHVENYGNNAQEYKDETEYDPVQAGVPVEKLRNQRMLGISTLIDERFKITLYYIRGGELLYAEQGRSWEPDIRSFPNNDYGISVSYLLNQQEDSNK